jgi:hypothetical protein
MSHTASGENASRAQLVVSAKQRARGVEHPNTPPAQLEQLEQTCLNPIERATNVHTP